MMLQAALNGPFTKTEHPALPVSVQELARDAAACVAAGARAIHLHPRDSDGRESLEAEVVDEVVMKVREACGVPVGVTTGAWIEADLGRRFEFVRAWRAPDYASVNLSEAGATERPRGCFSPMRSVEASTPGSASRTRSMSRTANAPRATKRSFAALASSVRA
jgi:uncharacterized protein (DUF849 family)